MSEREELICILLNMTEEQIDELIFRVQQERLLQDEEAC